jgi:RNA polymerase sigma-70 factor (ECF subfamily)
MQTAALSDAHLVLASAADPTAFGQVFDHHARTVFRFASRRVGSEVAKDVTAETFSIAFERRAGFDPGRGAVLPWLLGIATNVIRNHRRAERRQLRVTLGADVVHDDVDERLDAAAAAPALARALSALRPGDRDAVLLFAWTPLGYDGIAQALGIPIGTVASRLSRARQILRAELQRAGWTMEPEED